MAEKFQGTPIAAASNNTAPPRFPPQDGAKEKNNRMNSAAMVDGEASIVVVGQTTGSFDGPANGDWDIVVLKLDAASGTEIWRYQVCMYG